MGRRVVKAAEIVLSLGWLFFGMGVFVWMGRRQASEIDTTRVSDDCRVRWGATAYGRKGWRIPA